MKDKNFSRDRLVDFKPETGEIIEGCNFMQRNPHTKITTVSNLTFNNCNLVNCDIPADATTGWNNNVQISRCAHLHEDDGYTCEVECAHMTSKEEIVLDNVVVDTIYEYEDKVVS